MGEEVYKYWEDQPDYIVFGDGLYGGQLIDISQKFKDNNGNVILRVVFRPSREIEQAFNIPQQEKYPQGEIIKYYPESMVCPTSFNPKLGRRHIIMCDFNSQDTVLTQMNVILLNKIMMLEQENAALRQGLYKQLHEKKIMMAYDGVALRSEIAKLKEYKGVVGSQIIARGAQIPGAGYPMQPSEEEYYPERE